MPPHVSGHATPTPELVPLCIDVASAAYDPCQDTAEPEQLAVSLANARSGAVAPFFARSRLEHSSAGLRIAGSIPLLAATWLIAMLAGAASRPDDDFGSTSLSKPASSQQPNDARTDAVENVDTECHPALTVAARTADVPRTAPPLST